MLELILPRNEHIADRIIRVLIGTVALACVFAGPKTTWGWIGLVPFVTGLVGSCPIYTLIGKGTKKVSAG